MINIQKGETTMENLVETYCFVDNLVKSIDSRDKKRIV